VALGEVPAGVNVIILSRAEPPAGLARLRASGQLDFPSWDDLRLTADEGSRIAGLHARAGKVTLSEGQLRALHEQAEGWVAGLVLLLQSASAPRTSGDTARQNYETLFDYFAAEVFLRTDATTQAVLMKSSALPKMLFGWWKR